MELTLQNISKSYGKNKALSDFSMTFTPGIYALLGPNGSGKSTLMNIITDNLKADAGEIYWNGENAKKLGVKFRENIGFMPQYPGLYPSFSLEEFLWYIATLKGMKKCSETENEIKRVLGSVELLDVALHKVSSLSGGMKQRLALAQATLGDPKIIILDEPTAGLDPKQRISVRNYISSIALQRIVIIATHVVPDIEFIAKEAIILKKGKIIDRATPSELIKKMENKVWNIHCPEKIIDEAKRRFQIIGIAKSENNFVDLRLIHGGQPSEVATPLTPTLEDYYLSVFGGRQE